MAAGSGILMAIEDRVSWCRDWSCGMVAEEWAVQVVRGLVHLG